MTDRYCQKVLDRIKPHKAVNGGQALEVKQGMKFFQIAGFISVVTGISGIAGAIHFGTGYVASTVLVVGGSLALYITGKIEGWCGNVRSIRGSRPHSGDRRMEGETGEGESRAAKGGNDRC